MKRTAAALAAALVAALLLVVNPVSSVVTPAAHAACPYTGCIDTRTYVRRPKRIKVGRHFTVHCKVRSLGTAAPLGRVNVRVKGANTRRHKFIIRRKSAKLGGGKWHAFRFKGLGPGTYRVYCTYKKKKNSAFRPSGVNKKMRVVRWNRNR